MTTQSNPQVWDPDNTYSINELVQNRIKTNQQIKTWDILKKYFVILS